MDLAKHPALLADLYERNGATLVLAAHTRAQAPAHCKRTTPLPYTGAGTTSTGMVAGGLLAAGGLLLLSTRHRRHGAPRGPRGRGYPARGRGRGGRGWTRSGRPHRRRAAGGGRARGA